MPIDCATRCWRTGHPARVIEGRCIECGLIQNPEEDIRRKMGLALEAFREPGAKERAFQAAFRELEASQASRAEPPKGASQDPAPNAQNGHQANAAGETAATLATGPENAPENDCGDLAGHGEQPRPTSDPRSRPVTAALRALLDEREARGIARYGMSLQTHNGRSSPRDLVEELIDGAQYALQWEMERADLYAEVERLKNGRDFDRQVAFNANVKLASDLTEAKAEVERLKTELEETRDLLSGVRATADEAIARLAKQEGEGA